MEIVETDISQIHVISHLWEKLNEYNNGLHRNCFGERLAADWEGKSQEFKRRADQCRMKFNVARIDEDIVGYCVSSINDRGEAEIISLFVLSDSRSKGIGTALMNEHWKWFQENNATGIFLYVHPCNTTAIRFYWKFGFFSNSPTMEVCKTREGCPMP
jgi:diamine N-acetyltransferase